MFFTDYSYLQQTKAERLIARQAIYGEQIEIPSNMDRKVTAAFLRALLTNRISTAKAISNEYQPVIVACSLKIKGACIEGKLDLSQCGAKNNPLPHLTFEDCTFTDGIDLTATMLGGMCISHGFIGGKGVQAKGARFGGNVEIEQACFEGMAEMEIVLCQATIETDCILSQLKAGLRSGSANHAVTPPPLLALIDLRSISIGGDLQIEGTSLKAKPKAGSTDNSNENQGVAINAEGANVKGMVDIAPLNAEEICIAGQIKFVDATLGGGLRIKGITVESYEQEAAIQGDRMIAKGGVFIQSGGYERRRITGAIRFPEANIGSQFVIQGLTVAVKEKAAISMEGAVIKADFFIQEEKEQGCFILGEVNLRGASIDGQFALQGVAISSTPGYCAVQATDASIKGGFIINGTKEKTEVAIYPAKIEKDVIVIETEKRMLKKCEIKGKIDLIRSAIGNFSMEKTILESRDGGKDIAAIRANGARVNGDFTLASSEGEVCSIKGSIILVGATVNGALKILGAEITCDSKHAIFATGATIRGGFYIQKPSKLTGQIRISHARIGTKFEIEGSVVSLGEENKENAAIAADGAAVQGDMQISGNSTIKGEIRLCGASISGYLLIKGAQIMASAAQNSTGFALDCYMAEIAKGVSLNPAEEKDLKLEGIVGFAFAKLGALTIGAIQIDGTSNPPVELHGHLRLNHVQVRGSTRLTQLELRPPLHLEDSLNPISKCVNENLKRWLPVDTEVISLDAAHSDLGSKLEINLLEKSVGVIDLYGAKVRTLHDYSHRDKEPRWGNPPKPRWGDPPVGDDWLRPKRRYNQLKGVLLRLDGFIYDRLEDQGLEHRQRLKWLERQNPNGQVVRFFPQPYLQLSRVYREQGTTVQISEGTG